MSTGPVLAVCEGGPGQNDAAGRELLSRARLLGPAFATTTAALVLGAGARHRAGTLARFADDVLVAEAGLDAYHPERYLALTSQVCSELRPALVLLGHTHVGMDLAPRLAARLGLPYLSNVSDLEPSSPAGGLVFTRPVYKGALNATVAVDGGAVVATVQLGISRSAREGPPAPVRHVGADSYGRDTIEVIRMIEPVSGGTDITRSPVIVAAGRGIGTPENLELVRDLADALGGTVGCSRPLVDMGWLSADHQVGLSGRTVRPKLYVACGISGAPEHLAGMQGAGTIVAINTDPRAPMFKLADYGIVGDLAEVLPALSREARALPRAGHG